MNERIKQLAVQANVLHADFFDNELEVEKFAQLIVRECADITDSIGEHGYIASEQMLEHFGVK